MLISLTALAAAGRMLLLALPNISLTFFVVAVAGLAYGARMGAAVGSLAMLLTGMVLGGPTPGTLAGALATALLGGLAGLLRATGFPGPRRSAAGLLGAALLGVAIQLLFSVAADLATWSMLALVPQGAAALPLLGALLAAGLAFNAPAALFQAALFGGALQPALEALRAAGLAQAPRPRAHRPLREVVIAEAPRGKARGVGRERKRST